MSKINTSLVCGKIYAPSIDNPSKTKEYRSFFLRTYCSVDEVLDLLSHLSLEAYAYIVHDKDVDENGELHEPHIHLVAHLEYPKKVRPTTLSKFLKSGNSLLEVCKDKYKIYQYLTHENSPDKFQYSPDEVYGQNKSFYIADCLKSKSEKRAEDMAFLLDDVLQLSMRDFALKYGRDGILNYSKYKEFALLTKSTSYRELFALEDKFAQAKDCYNSAVDCLHYAPNNKVLYRFICRVTDTLTDFASCSPASLIDKLLSAYIDILPQPLEDDFYI